MPKLESPKTNPEHVQLQGYIPGAIGRITELHARYYHHHKGWDLNFEAEVATELSDFLRQFNSAQNGFWLALCEEEIVGSIAICSDSPQEARLRWFLVDPAYQGQGIGRLLIQTAIDFCQAAQFEQVYLWTTLGLSAAHHLYRQFGFVLIHEEIDDRWGQSVVHQKLSLQVSPPRR